MPEKKVSKEQIDALMDKVFYHVYQIEGTTTTHATAFIDGFPLAVGASPCVPPYLFDAEKGEQFALEDAVKKAEAKLWELEGYRLKFGCSCSNKECCNK